MEKSNFIRIEKSHLFIIDRIEALVDILKLHSDSLKSNGFNDNDLLHYQKYISDLNNIADDAFWHLLDFLHDYEKTSKFSKDN